MPLDRSWFAPILLLLLGFISVLFGALHLNLLGQGDVGAEHQMASTHYFNMPVPIIIHIISGSFFNIFVPLQFAKQIRSRWPKLHRYLGRCLLICALGFGFSGLWMNHFYPQYGGVLKYLGIAVHCLVLVVSLLLAYRAIRRGDVESHKAWMMRMTAAALSPATQRLFIIPTYLLIGEDLVTDVVIAGVIWFGLAVNLGFVEWILRKKKASDFKRTSHKQVAESSY